MASGLKGGGLLAEEGLSVAADEGGPAAEDAALSLLRAGGAGARLSMSMDSVSPVAEKYGIDLSENDIQINKAVAGLGSTAPDQSITLYPGAFENEEQLGEDPGS